MRKIKPTEKVCPVCGQVFSLEGHKASKKYCSAVCLRRAAYLKRAEREAEAREEVACPICGTYFIPRAGRRYCCQACARKARYQGYTVKIKKSTVLKCKYCGKEYVPVMERAQYCSGKCQLLAAQRRRLEKYYEKMGKIFKPRRRNPS